MRSGIVLRRGPLSTLAEPEVLRHTDVGSPLLYHRGRYAGLAGDQPGLSRRPAA
ncbi:hypothetical protein [Micromonospora sp. NPDC048839]|uniref:hypothetical protein n=1 Tax=Micromonospora sp. NPDC048839 TaxID=3155641 RepID=UPI0033F13579